MDKATLERELATRELCRRDFPVFVREFFKREKGIKFEWSFHHDLMSKALNDLMKDEDQELLIINIPPRHSKTEIVTKLFAVWWLLNHPTTKIISTGYSAQLTQDFGLEARDYYVSKAVELLFPRKSLLREDQARKDDWKNEDGGGYYATGVGGSITGRGADLFIIDDPLNPNDAESSTSIKLDRVNTWFSNVAMSRINSRQEDGKLKRGKFVVIMQRIHDNDLCGYLERHFAKKFSEGAYKKLSLTAIAEVDDEFRKKGEALFTQMYPIKVLMSIKMAMTNERGLNFFAAQYQQNPIDIEKAEFKREDFKYYQESLITERKLKTIIAIDPAISEKQGADATCLAVVGIDKDELYYIRYVVNDRMPVSDMLDHLFRLQSAFNADVVIETVGFQQVLVQQIKQQMKDRKQFFRLIEIKSRGEKEARIRATLEPLYSNYRVYHEEGLKYSELEEQLIRFPKSKHDDIIDAVETAITCLRGKVGGSNQARDEIIRLQEVDIQQLLAQQKW